MKELLFFDPEDQIDTLADISDCRLIKMQHHVEIDLGGLFTPEQAAFEEFHQSGDE